VSNHKNTAGDRRGAGYWQGIAGQTFAVVLGVGTAMGLRALLTPWIGESAAPFITAFPVIAAVAFFSGVGVGAATSIGCALWVAIPFWPPYLSTTDDWRLLALFVPAAFLIAFFCGQAAEHGAQRIATEPEDDRPATVRWLRWSMLAAAALPALFFAAAAWSTYRDAIRDAATRVDRAARVAVEQASKVLDTNQVVARHVITALGDATLAEARARELELHEQLLAMVRDIPQIQSVWVVGSDGRAVVSSRFFPIPHDVDFSDREGLTVFQRGEAGTYITAPRIGRLTNEPFFDLAAPWRGADGALHGAVWVSLHPQYFTDFYAGLAEDEPSLLVKMFRADGVILARRPPAPDQATRLPGDSPLLGAVAAGRTEGLFDGPSMDGEHRVASFRKLDRYPVYVATGVPRAVVLEAWQRRTALLAAFTFPTAMALIYIAWVALRRTRREFAAVRELHQEVEHRARAENALRQVQKLEALGRLTGGVAHDFNNLLMVVSNNLHLLRRLQPALADSRELAAIARAVGSGERLTRQLLAFARRQPLHPEVLSLQERLPALVALVAPTLGPRIESECVVDPDTPSVELDAAELELAIINLAVNAKDAMRDGGHFRVTARRARLEEAEMPGDFVLISVADNGTGIEPEVIERVFEPFFTTKPHGQGTGLGLSQVYGLCTQAGGTARVESSPGRGTEVKLFLPAIARTLPAVAEAVAASDEPLHCTVLLVEDNEDLAGATQALLQRAGCRVHWARSGDRARDLISAGGTMVDVVVSDMAMPGELDGLGLAEYLRQHHPELPVVLITGYASQLHEASARRFTVLAKPCPPDVLFAAIRAALKRRFAGASPASDVTADKKSPVE
jgi:signal transduction histidine kinase/ActR/RegA family two-component response regulator